jgi:hypothetical protein
METAYLYGGDNETPAPTPQGGSEKDLAAALRVASGGVAGEPG